MSEPRLLLLDVNALLALVWPNHQFHRLVSARLDRPAAPGWATCALTQLGFVAAVLQPGDRRGARDPAQALDLLTRLTADALHVFLEPLPALHRVAKHFRHLLGHQQVTAAYLLAVAATNGATCSLWTVESQRPRQAAPV